MQCDQAVTTSGRNSVDNDVGLSGCDEDLVNVVVLITGVLADRVINVLRGVILVDGHGQRGEWALTSGEVVEKTDVVGAGFVDRSVVVIPFGDEVAVLVIPAIKHTAGGHVVGEVCSERTAVGDGSGLRAGGRNVHCGHSRDSRAVTSSSGIVTLGVESGAGHDVSGEIETGIQAVAGVLVGIPTAGGGGFIDNGSEGHGSGTAAHNRLHFRFCRQWVDGDVQRCHIALAPRIGVITGSIDGGTFRTRVLEAVGGHERLGVG